MFHHIVDSDKTATIFLKELNRKKLTGVFNFIPINRISRYEHRYPKVDTAFSLKSKLDYTTELEPVIQHTFGKILVCNDLTNAANLARSTGLTCVTLDGEKASGKGTLSGGYINPLRSKMKNFHFRRYEKVGPIKLGLKSLLAI